MGECFTTKGELAKEYDEVSPTKLKLTKTPSSHDVISIGSIDHLLSAKALYTHEYTNININMPFPPPQIAISNYMHDCVYF